MRWCPNEGWGWNVIVVIAVVVAVVVVIVIVTAWNDNRRIGSEVVSQRRVGPSLFLLFTLSLSLLLLLSLNGMIITEDRE